MGVHEGALEHTWRWLQYSPGSQWRARDLYHYFQLMGQVVALTRLPPRQRLREGARVEQAMEEAPEGFYITRLITPAIGRCVTTEVETRAALQVARTALAVERWRVENGAWPASLDDLVPEMLPEVPEDPFSEGILGYARLADGVCVYSLGKDGWEGGILRDEPRTEPYQGWDITFRLLDPKLRGATETELTDEVDADGQTLLHLAARLGDLELVRRLLDEGADVNAVDNEGRTPTGRAVEGGHEDVAELLRERGGVE
jgi:hypothetical protein